VSNYQLSINNYQLPEGYKQTEVGVIPEDWEVCPLQSLTANSEPITYGVLKPGEYVYEGIPLLQIKDVIHGGIKAEELHRIGEQLDRQYSRTKLSGGEIVVSLVGTIGKIAYIPASLLGANLHRNLAKISISKENDSKFIFYQLESERIQAAIKLTTFGSTQALLNLGDLRALLVVVPSLQEQRSIATALSDVDALIAALDKLIAKKRHLKTATMQQLLTGKKRLPRRMHNGELIIDNDGNPVMFGPSMDNYQLPKGYKQTEVGVIPEDWILAPLEKVSAFITKGSTPTTYGFSWTQDGILFLRSECVSENGLDLSQSMFISEEAHSALSRSELRSGDLLITITGNVGRVVYLSEDFGAANMNQHIARVRIIDEDVCPKFVYHYLNQ
jgi:type I restriction enzyme S subunit